MRYDKNTPRRIGGLLLDAIMLVFVFTFSFSDPKMVVENSSDLLLISGFDGHGIVFGIDAVQGSFLKLISKGHLSPARCFGLTSNPSVARIRSAIFFLNSQVLYNIFCSDTTINAP